MHYRTKWPYGLSMGHCHNNYVTLVNDTYIMWLSAHHSGNKYITSADAQESNNTLELSCRNHM